MARSRNIKPGLYKNEDLAECSIWARYLFPGLWTLADREGRLEDRPKRIKAELLAFDSHDVEPLLRELEARGFLVRYRNEDGAFIQITKFSKHQTPHYSEKKSVIKPPILPESERCICDETPGALPEHSRSEAGLKRVSQPPDSLIHRLSDSPTPDLPIPDSPNPESGKPPSAGPQADTPKTDTYPAEFEALWSAYPKRMGDNPKRRALHAWRARCKEGVAPSVIADGVERYAIYVRAQGKEHTEFVKQAATFLGPDKAFLEQWGAGPRDSHHAAFAEAERLIFGSGEKDITE